MTIIATIIFALGIVALFALDREVKPRSSNALWLPIIWFAIAGSRLVSQWIDAFAGKISSDATYDPNYYLEGSPIDRTVLTLLLAAALVVLAWRRKRLWTVLRVNGPILLFFSYCGLSILWSDFPEVAFKRWIKAIGDLAMVLVVLTDPDWSAAIKRVLARASFLLIPLSVLFIKYYPSLGRGYHPWVWTPYYTGVTTNKNELGYICLIFGIASVWRWLQAFRQKQEKRRTAALAAYSVLLAMVLWLFWMAQSLTSLACFLMASGLMIATSLSPRARRPWAVHSMVGAVLLVSSLALFGDVG